MAAPNRAELTPTRPGRHRQPDERAPRLVLPRLLEQCRRLLRRRRRGVGRWRRRWLRAARRADGDPVPADGTFHGTREDPVDLPDGRRRQWTTHVRLTAVVALVLGLCPV